jgi:hypothetical protein
VDVSKVKSEVEKLRTNEGKNIDSAYGDTIQALKIYGRHLVEQASKVDPIIGRRDKKGYEDFVKNDQEQSCTYR